MSQLEQDFRRFLSRNPEIEKSYAIGLINRRSLARHLIRQGIAKSNQLEAVIAMLRRYNFKKLEKEDNGIFKDFKITIKDKILILDLEKEKELFKNLQKLISHTNYDKGDTLKIVIGSSSIKVFIDQEKEKEVKDLFKEFRLKDRYENTSEMSLFFPENARGSKGILSTLTKELAVNDIIITEFLTATPELLIYLNEGYVLKAYEVLKGLQR